MKNYRLGDMELEFANLIWEMSRFPLEDWYSFVSRNSLGRNPLHIRC